jgi:hypothetical protein
MTKLYAVATDRVEKEALVAMTWNAVKPKPQELHGMKKQHCVLRWGKEGFYLVVPCKKLKMACSWADEHQGVEYLLAGRAHRSDSPAAGRAAGYDS